MKIRPIYVAAALVGLAAGVSLAWYQASALVPSTLDSRDYNYARVNLAPTKDVRVTGDLSSSGSGKVLTIAAAPKGLKTGSYTYISGGTGTAETALITATTCAVAGGLQCTITVTTANAHTGPWSLSGANGGMQEAINYAVVPAPLTLNVSPGQVLVRASVKINRRNVAINIPEGVSIIPGSCSMKVFDTNVPVHTTSQLTQATDAISFSGTGVIDASTCDGVNSVVGISHTLASATEWVSINGMSVTGIGFNNVGIGVYVERSMDVSLRNIRSWGSTRFVATDPNTDPQYRTYRFIVDGLHHESWCKDGTSDCATLNFSNLPIIQTDVCVSCKFTNNNLNLNTFPNTPGTVDGIWIRGASEDTLVQGNTIVLARDAVAYDKYGPYWPRYSRVKANAFDQPWRWDVNIKSGDGSGATQAAAEISLEDNEFTNPRTESSTGLVHVGSYSNRVDLNGNKFLYIMANQKGLAIDTLATSVTVRGGAFANDPPQYTASSVGIYVANGADNLDLGANVQFHNLGSTIIDLSSTVNKVLGIGLPRTTVPTSIPSWVKVSVVKLAGTWSIAGAVPQSAAAATSQQLPIMGQLMPTGTVLAVTAARIKNATACAGVSTLTASVGSGASTTYFTNALDLKAAVSATNFAPTDGKLNNYTTLSASQDYIYANLTSSGGNLNAVTDGCAFDVWLLWATLPN